MNINRQTKEIYSFKKEENNFDLPILSTDTNNIIIYSNEVENYKKKKKKYNFFDLIKKQSDEQKSYYCWNKKRKAYSR